MRRKKALLILSIIFIILSLFLSIKFGAVNISYLKLFSGDEVTGMIVKKLRLPRVLNACVTDWALSFVGAVLQSIFRNPLADPYVIGVSSSAALGFVLSGLTGIWLKVLGIPIFSVLLSISAVFFLLRLSIINGNMDLQRMLLIGVIISSFCGSIIVFLLILFPSPILKGVFFWLLGDLGSADIISTLKASIIVLLGSLICFFHYRELELLTMGTESAIISGVNVRSVIIWNVIGCGLIISAVVSNTGMIGFIGLLVPNIIRGISGPSHPYLMLMSGLMGGGFLLLADLFGRILYPPKEIPVGVITAIVGAPVFIWILRKR